MKAEAPIWKGKGTKQKERTNIQPREHHSKAQTHRTKAEINPFALNFNKLELVQLLRATMCTFSTGAHLQPLASFLFFWFNFCDVSKLVIHKNISQIWL